MTSHLMIERNCVFATTAWYLFLINRTMNRHIKKKDCDIDVLDKSA
jgi:hypothetical protein